MRTAVRIRGLYAVTPDTDDTAALTAKVEAALLGGAALLQYRNKSADPNLRVRQARALQTLCRKYDVPLIINDHLELVTAVDAVGLHLGKGDTSLSDARASLPPGKLLGASCYNRLEDAVAAVRAGVDYVAFGSFFPSAVKPEAVQAFPTLLREAKKRLEVPIVAIGGITQDNAAQLIAAGADAVAVVSALFGARDVRVAAQQFKRLFTSALKK